MKKLALILAFLIGSVASAFAACTSPAVMHDFPGTSFNMSLATVPDGNCGSNVAVPTWAGGTLGAMANYGTSPGAVLVPGVNAFITNTPPVSQSGTWTVQPGNTANTTPWLASISQGGNTAKVQAGNAAAAADVAVTVTDPNVLAAINAAIPAGTNLIGKVGIDQTTPGTTNNVTLGDASSNALVLDPCQGAVTTTPISISSAATSVIVAGTSAKKTYICGMMLFSAGTTNVGIVQGSGSTCGTSTLGLIGGATAGTGPNLTAQAGFNASPAGYHIAATTVNANDICLINGSAIQVSGYIATAVR